MPHRDAVDLVADGAAHHQPQAHVHQHAIEEREAAAEKINDSQDDSHLQKNDDYHEDNMPLHQTEGNTRVLGVDYS